MTKPKRIDHWGREAKWFMDYPAAHLDALARDMKEVETVFRVEFGLQLYLVYGTLLGAARDGDFIGHDIDIDLAYVSRARSMDGVLRERDRIARFFDDFGKVADIPNHGRFLLYGPTDPETGTVPHGIEIYTSFVTQGEYYIYPSIPGWLRGRDIKPFSTIKFRGHEFCAPKHHEKWLELQYGKSWRVPVMPDEYREDLSRFDCFEFLRTDL